MIEPESAPTRAPVIKPTKLPTRASVLDREAPTQQKKSPYPPQSRAFVRWREEDDRPRVLAADEARDRAELEALTAEGITLREKLEREGTLAAYLNTKKAEREAKAKLSVKATAKRGPTSSTAKPASTSASASIPTSASSKPTKAAP